MAAMLRWLRWLFGGWLNDPVQMNASGLPCCALTLLLGVLIAVLGFQVSGYLRALFR